jgi:uncharacterized protein DUF5681
MSLEGGEGYKVGYGRPPRHTRFKKGHSGNPAGRPRGSKNFRTLIDAALDEKVQVVENGRRRQISKREVIAQQLVNKSAGADLRATKILFDMFKDESEPTLPEGDSANQRDVLEQIDQAIIERALARRKVGHDE